MINSVNRLLMLLAMLLVVLPEVLAVERLYFRPLQIEAGEIKTIEVELDNTVQFYGFQLDIALPDGLSMVEKPGGEAECSLSNRASSGFMLMSNRLSTSVWRIGAFSASHSPINGCSGTLFTITVKADDTFRDGAIQLNRVKFTDSNDRSVSIDDFAMEVGEVKINNFYIPDFSISVSETKQISFVLDNETEFSAFQTDLYLPSGLVADKQSVRITSRGADHTVSTEQNAEGNMRIVCLSLSSSDFNGNSGALLTMNVTANEKLVESSKIYLKNQIFSVNKAVEYVLPNTQTNVTCDKAAVESIVLNKTQIELQVNESEKLTAILVPSYAYNKNVTWSSNNPEVATVDAIGNVTAVAIGNATITATAASGVNATCEVNIVATSAASISLNKTEATLKVTETIDLVATILPETTTDKSVTWKSSDEAVATVDANGKVTAVAAGLATITATAASGVNASCSVTVLPREIAPITVTRSEELMIIMDGETAEMNVSVTGGYAEGLTFTWLNNDKIVGTANLLKVVGRCDGNKKSNEIYTVRVVDECDGVTIFDRTYRFEVETWPRPALDVTINTDSDTDNIKIREGNLLELSAETPQGGYGTNWNFDWYLNGAPISNESAMSHVMTMTSGTEMKTEKNVVTLTATNFGPYGTVWGEAVSAPVGVTVYRRPLTPKQLLRKEDGTTHELVVMSQYDDDELVRLSYSFVYGYTDAAGEDHIVATTDKRYCSIDEQVLHNASFEKWSYSRWVYADGGIVTSGKRYLDGSADEDFDASDFSNDASCNESLDFSDSNIWIKSNGKDIKISIETEEDAHFDLITISGVLIDTVTIPANTFMSLDYTADRLTPDIYVISINTAKRRVVKKIIII